MRIAARLAVELLCPPAFCALAYLTAMQSWAGKWFLPAEPLWALFFWGPLTAAAGYGAATALAAQARGLARNLPIALALAAAGLVALMGRAAQLNRHGLWREWTALDSHFSNSLMRGYYFDWWVGAIGVWALFVFYLTFRLRLAAPERFTKRAVFAAAAPLAAYCAVLLRQLWVPAPYFTG